MSKWKLTHNLGWKILALFSAIIIWLIVVNIDDPISSAVFTNIPVSFINEEVVTNQGKTYKVEDDSREVTVTVYAKKRTVLSKLSNESIMAVADLSQMDVNTYLVPITVIIPGYENQYSSAVVSPQNFQVKIEDVIGNTFPISVSAKGTPRDGYVVGELKADPENITVNGSESDISAIAKVVAEVDISGLSKNAKMSAELIYYDENGNEIDKTQLNDNLGDEGLTVDVQILNTQDLEVTANYSGTPLEGYSVVECSCEPETIEVCGTEKDLQDLETLAIPASQINMDQASSKKEFTVDITPYLPEGIQLVDEAAANVIVTVDVERNGTRTIEIPVDAIRISNLSDNLQLEFPSDLMIELEFRGSQEALEKLDITNAVYIDMKKYTTTGTFDVPINVNTELNVTMTGSPTVKVKLSRKSADSVQ